MIDEINVKEAFDRPRVNKPACMSENCGATCAYGYSCHNQRVGRASHFAWPFVALAVVMVIGLLM